jgi:hypothetical protein
MADFRRMPRAFFSPDWGVPTHLIARWLFLRALGAIYFSAFFSLLFQVRGLIGSHGILPAAPYLETLRPLGALRFWYAPTLLWIHPSDGMIVGLCWAGLIASLLAILNLFPRITLLVCFVCFLSFVCAAQEFSGYQSDGMLLEAGFLALFLAPRGILPGWGIRSPGLRAARLLLLWEWFRIYFESGVVKLSSGDPAWRNLTALYEYYQNGPLPTWVGWYLQHLPHWFHIATAAATLGMELGVVWIVFVSRRMRILCFWIVTMWQIGVIATANYAFLNYLVLVLAFLLLDDSYLARLVPARWRLGLPGSTASARSAEIDEPAEVDEASAGFAARWADPLKMGVAAVMLTWSFYATCVPLVQMFWSGAPVPERPVALLEPFRIANQYGLFAVMTPHRYEIEFQGSNDGQNWTAYPFRYKPQDVRERPRIYAPYQPRFDWNLWFASLGPWQENPMVPQTEALLLENDYDVLGLFQKNPFASGPPKYVRAVLWQYWFSTPEEKRTQGVWWRRQMLGTYAPTLTRLADGRFQMVEAASLMGPPQS